MRAAAAAAGGALAAGLLVSETAATSRHGRGRRHLLSMPPTRATGAPPLSLASLRRQLAALGYDARSLDAAAAPLAAALLADLARASAGLARMRREEALAVEGGEEEERGVRGVAADDATTTDREALLASLAAAADDAAWDALARLETRSGARRGC